MLFMEHFHILYKYQAYFCILLKLPFIFCDSWKNQFRNFKGQNSFIRHSLYSFFLFLICYISYSIMCRLTTKIVVRSTQHSYWSIEEIIKSFEYNLIHPTTSNEMFIFSLLFLVHHKRNLFLLRRWENWILYWANIMIVMNTMCVCVFFASFNNEKKKSFNKRVC